MRFRFSFPFKKKNLFVWGILIILVAIGVLAYIYREPLSKSFVFKRAEVEEVTVPFEPPTPDLEELKEEPLKIEEEKIVKETTITVEEPESEVKEEDGEKVYIETAEHGEGITHLARKALRAYLRERGENIALTKAHKIFIEDYMQNKTGDRWLKLGEKISFSESLIEEAIEASLKLTDAQLQNILNFTPPPTFVE